VPSIVLSAFVLLVLCSAIPLLWFNRCECYLSLILAATPAPPNIVEHLHAFSCLASPLSSSLYVGVYFVLLFPSHDGLGNKPKARKLAGILTKSPYNRHRLIKWQQRELNKQQEYE